MDGEWHLVEMHAWARNAGLLWEVRLPSGRIIQFPLDEFYRCFMQLGVDDLARDMYDDTEGQLPFGPWEGTE
uniref:Uncharacterized protein n=1 Tax=viral metagenome TaxID=1070528 RepID=A0A6M3JL74_9ZZZZ